MRKSAKTRGLTFIEVMVALVILTGGLVAVFRVFISSLNQINHLNNRLYASVILDNRIAEIERNLRIYKTLPFALEQGYSVDVGGKTVEFQQEMQISAIDEFVEIFNIHLTLKWNESNREASMSRSSYLSDFYSTQ